MAIRIMNERRPVPIPDDLRDLYENVFFRNGKCLADVRSPEMMTHGILAFVVTSLA